MTDTTPPPAPEPTPAAAPPPSPAATPYVAPPAAAAAPVGAPPRAGAPVPAPPGVDYPGKTLGIVGLVLAFIFTLLGLILSIVANGQSKAAGYTNTPAKVGIIVSIVFLVLGLIGGIIAGVVAASAFQAIAAACAELGPGIHEINGVTYTCS